MVQLDLNKIGMDPTILSRLRRMIKMPNGIILVTGPTGSGKTTTLYSALNELNDVSTKIITRSDFFFLGIKLLFCQFLLLL